ncbi:uncharacterized protein At1g76070 [Malania oleifera]|uniref:uncharacterized protein At1g76070 n=1 Tax=Malania oleifera TaxID=397392 RepID=UPI0025AE4DD1|nr:uncharacterized protein At1g76070 [Malania oleifera]
MGNSPMEKSTVGKSKNAIMRFLPKVATAVTFQNPPFSPGRNSTTGRIRSSDINANRLRTTTCRGFSGPIISIIPVEARRETSKNGSFDSQEPTSPKVSCIGQIKHKHKKKKNKKSITDGKSKNQVSQLQSEPKPQMEMKKELSTIRRIFSARPARKSDPSGDVPNQGRRLSDAAQAPSLHQTKRFSSGRDALAGFDWRAQIAPAESRERREYYSYEDRGESEEEDEEAIIPFSAPMVLGGEVASERRKEINLWKRRTMAPPEPLQLRTTNSFSN